MPAPLTVLLIVLTSLCVWLVLAALWVLVTLDITSFYGMVSRALAIGTVIVVWAVLRKETY